MNYIMLDDTQLSAITSIETVSLGIKVLYHGHVLNFVACIQVHNRSKMNSIRQENAKFMAKIMGLRLRK
ncbi:unnamed protein product [Rhizophagus irregularis]|uniref:Uncharacterized protein n=1 Tax=Rhizophagus irregularis TaxID=588596 RepID=A0A915ZTQ4_9GLOM|nr:unnamed protein product [Rhizophagus irregularis]CAB5386843.1 unnamed protein product [Rhizophagus irregularis]